MIRVLVVDDSKVFSDILTKILQSDIDIKVIGRAVNGVEALNLAEKLRPDVITMDIQMPMKSGVEATEEIMRRHPTPIIILSSYVNKKETKVCFDALKAGAVDIMEKPTGSTLLDYQEIEEELIKRVKVAAGVKVFTHFDLNRASAERSLIVPRAAADRSQKSKIVVIGASTGGPIAINTILSSFPRNFPAPCVVVQHIAKGFLDGFVDWLSRECSIKVKVAASNEHLESGTAYFPPEEHHLGFFNKGYVRLYNGLPYGGHRPSITLVMKSASEAYGSGALGVLLTGMGRDGAEGLKAIKSAGGRTIAQDEKTSAVFGMPKEAIENNAADYILPVDKIAKRIIMMV